MENIVSQAIAKMKGWDGDSDHCRFCNSEPGEWRDELSKKEWGISGLCQKCQDNVFTPDDEE